MKQRFRGYVLLISLFMLAAASNAAIANDGTPVMSRILKSGELVLGTSANMPPMTFKQEDGTLGGLDISLAELMADVMKVKLVVKVMPFDELIPALNSGKVDVVLSNMTINPSRNMKVAFVGPYMTSGKCIVTKEETIAKTDDPKKLNANDLRLAVMKDSTSEDFVRTLMPNVKIETVKEAQDGAELVAKDKVGGMLTDYPICLSLIKNNPDAGFVSVFSLLTYEPIGIAIAGNDPLLINWVENFIERLKQTAVLEAIGKKWLGDLGSKAGMQKGDSE